MGLLLQIFGVLILVVSFIFSIIAIINGTSKSIGVFLLVVGALMVKIGRIIYSNTRKK